MNTPAWTQLDVTFIPVHVSAQNESCYSLTASGEIYYFNGYTWMGIALPLSNPFVAISASIDGSLVGTDSDDQSYLFSYGTWSPLSAPTAGKILNVCAGDGESYVMYDSLGSISQISYGISSTISTSESHNKPTKLTYTLGLAHVWGTDANGTVFKKISNNWVEVTGKKLKQIDVSLSSSGAVQVCGVDPSGNGWMYDGSWKMINKPVFGIKFTSLEASNGRIWATTSNGSLYCGTF